MELQLLIRRYLALGVPLIILALTACEKEITVDLPETEPRIVVEASIETGQAPFVLLTRTQKYFAPTSLASIAASFVSEAEVRVNDGVTTHELIKLCSSLLTEEQLEEVALLTGFNAGLLANANICIWTSPTLLGENGRTYRLEVDVENKSLTSTTTIPNPVPLDSLWFRLALQQPGDDTLGLIWATINDPDTMGNHYRWFAQRINRRPDGRMKDMRYIAPLFSVYEDRYVNGLTFDLNFARGRAPFSDSADEPGEAQGYFKRNDTVAIKMASIGRAEFLFYKSYASNVVTEGDVFSTPANIISNIDGGLGVWVGYGTYLDTVICVPQ